MGPHSLDCEWGPRDGRAPQHIVSLSYMKSGELQRKVQHTPWGLLCKNRCPAPPSGPRSGRKHCGRGTGRPTVCPTRHSRVRLSLDLLSAA